MASAVAHRDRFVRELRYADVLASYAPSHWEIVVRFYAALHLTQGYLVTKDYRFHAGRHADRSAAIRRSPELREPFPRAYNRLRDLSEQVRYDPEFMARPQDFAAAARDLDSVRRIVLPKLERKL
jgi:hypothetical protein